MPLWPEQGGERGQGILRGGPSLLPFLQNELLNYVQAAINDMVQQCCSSAQAVPRGLGLFSKLDLIQVRTCAPQAGSDLSLSWASAPGVSVLALPSLAAWCLHVCGGVLGSFLASQQTCNEHLLVLGQRVIKQLLPCLGLMCSPTLLHHTHTHTNTHGVCTHADSHMVSPDTLQYT